MLKIGVLSLQGAIEEHELALTQASQKLDLNVKLSRVILPEEIEEIDGIVMPGGESSAMILMGKKNGMLNALTQKLSKSLPAFGTCAGAILLSKRVRRNKQSPMTEGAFPLLDIDIRRNGYGRQAESFSTPLKIQDSSNHFHGVFIRAPVIEKIESKLEILSSFQNKPVLVKQDNLIACTFHPELTNDTRIHELFLKIVLQYAR
ncbi:MAG: pyridoxal 5'-phosphate synthase glutaminase subunit PdxT [Candidatus Kariarchaeaceae archaeon]|jgi:5'-phosphate synthase pdxT subunit